MKPQGAGRDLTVSVIIPTFNSELYIGSALASVFAQEFAPLEVIVVDDGSDKPELLHEALVHYEDRIIFLSSDNRGPSHARNLAIAKAKGHLIAFLDSDDLWMPHHLADSVQALFLDPSQDLVYADAMIFGESPLAGKTFMQVTPSNGYVTLEALLSLGCSVITSCVVVRKEALLKVGCFDENLRLAEDFDLWVRLVYSGCQLGYHRHVSAYHRMHDRSLTHDKVASCQNERDVYLKFQSTFIESPLLRQIIKDQIARCTAELALENGKRQLMASEYDLAAKELDRAIDHYRSRKLYLARVGLKVAPSLLQLLYRCAQIFYKMRERSRAKSIAEVAKMVGTFDVR